MTDPIDLDALDALYAKATPNWYVGWAHESKAELRSGNPDVHPALIDGHPLVATFHGGMLAPGIDDHEKNAALAEAIHAAYPVLRERIRELEALARDSKRRHYSCDDTWYSCPMDEDGCCNDAKAEECDCGADEWNARVDAVLAGSAPDPRDARIRELEAKLAAVEAEYLKFVMEQIGK